MVAAQLVRAQRVERERLAVQRAAEIHAAWLAAQSNSTIPNTGYAEAERQAAEVARSEAALLAEIRAELARERGRSNESG
jgi:hypothetical protein